MNYLDLFHGIGGFARGAFLAEMKFDNHYCSDIETYCQKLYKLRFPESIQLGDITKIKTEELPHGEWIITGGFPCQDVSIAGTGKGLDGARSGLWFEYWRIIRDLQPRFAIMENVGAITFRGLDRVLGSLSEIGYDAEWQDIRAEDMGAPHRRERIWIVAYPSSERLEREKSKRIGSDKPGLPSECCDKLSDARSIGENEQRNERLQEASRNERGRDNLGRGKTLDECRKWWSVEPSVRGMADGISSELDLYQGRLAKIIPEKQSRLKGLGNAIVPQIAEILFRQIKPLL